jgi:nucleoside phosphorylase
MLDEVHEALPQDDNDSNCYALGVIAKHCVAIACLPNHQYGTNNAAIVFTNMKRTFGNIQLGLMVGVGGGAPSQADLRLGDIVVGTKVIQHDMGKSISVVSSLRSKHYSC